MLSILIPVYNYNIVSLVEEIQTQTTALQIPFELLAFEDGSKSRLNEQNKQINLLSGCMFKELEVNIGRSAIRNLLAQNAQYEQLLFVDAGSYPKKKTFIKEYLTSFHEDVVIGGMTNLDKPPSKPYKLRWLYTKKRESNFKNGKVFCSSNFLIKKSVIQAHPFDESIKKYGCEDVLFFTDLKKHDISITYIDNPVIHDSEDSADSFVFKTENAIENLVILIASGKLSTNSYRLTQIYEGLQKLKLDMLVAFIFSKSKPLLKRNFRSSSPSILLFDFYRLGYYCSIINKR